MKTNLTAKDMAGFLGALAIVRNGGAIPDNPARKIETKEVTIPDFDFLVDRAAAGFRLKDGEVYFIAAYINEVSVPEAGKAWEALQKNVKNLFAVHPFIESKMISISREWREHLKSQGSNAN